MSWFSNNYEKALLGGAVVAALGLTFVGWRTLAGVDDAFASHAAGRGRNDTAVVDADLVPKAIQSLQLDRAWTQGEDDKRLVDLFTGISLFIRSSDPENVVDPIDDPPIHPPIPNTWWLENRLDPGFADSPQRDPDQDGFSNQEEFLAKTDPNDGKKFPDLISKLMFVSEESVWWSLRPGYGADGSFPFNYLDSTGAANRLSAADPVQPGKLFFPKQPAMNRFKLLGHEVRREMNPAINIEVEVTMVKVEDQRPNKKGKVYEFPSPLSEGRAKDFRQYDRTAVFSLEALGMQGSKFKVEENTSFALPPDSPKKNLKLKSVTAETATVEYTDASGTLRTLEIGKGSTPRLNN